MRFKKKNSGTDETTVGDPPAQSPVDASASSAELAAAATADPAQASNGVQSGVAAEPTSADSATATAEASAAAAMPEIKVGVAKPGPPAGGSVSKTMALSLRRTGWLVIGGAVAPIVLWMVFAPLSIAVVAPAYVKVDLNRRPVQHLEGGIVRRVLVRDGQTVRAGEPVIELGDVAVDANRNRLQLMVLAEKATVARLEAERVLARTLEFDAELTTAAAADPRIADTLRKEEALFASRREALGSESSLLRQQRTHIQSEIESLQAEVAQAQSSLGTQQANFDRSRALQGDGFVSATRVSELEASVTDYASRLEERRSEVARAQQRLVEVDLKLTTTENNYVQLANDQLKTSIGRLSELEQEQRKSDDAAQRQVIVAPADGEIIDLKVTSPGAVLQPGETIADIVPSNAPLRIEAQIRPEDIVHVTRGQNARIKVLAFRYGTTLTGAVEYVSADRLVDQRGFAYYTAMVVADAKSLAEARDVKLQAGMPAEVYIEGAPQTPLRYITEPITATMRRAATPL